MSGTDQSQVKAFKKAFNIKPTEPSWDKVKAGMANGQKELRKWADLLSDVAPLSDAFHKVETSRVTMEEACTKCEELYDKSGDAKSKRNIVSKVRDKILPELLKQIDECRKAAKNLQVAQSVHTKVHGPDGSGDVEHDIDKDVAVFWTDIPGFDSMDAKKRRAVMEKAAEKTARGLDLYDQIILGKAPEKATRQNVTDLLWALKSKAEEKNGPYVRGAMTVPGGDKLRAFLDTCQEEVYPRSSSHLLEQQGKAKSSKEEMPRQPPPGQTARGMDFYGGGKGLAKDPIDADGLLPTGMNTLLYQQVTGEDGEKYLYLKMETEGAYGSGGGNKALDPTAPAPRPKRAVDTLHVLAHGVNFVKSKLGKGDSDKDLADTREETPKHLADLAKRIVEAVADKATKRALAASFGTGINWIGQKKRVVRLNSFLDTLTKLAGASVDAHRDAFGDKATRLILELTTAVEREYGEDTEEEFGRRTGNEVMLTAGDI